MQNRVPSRSAKQGSQSAGGVQHRVSHQEESVELGFPPRTGMQNRFSTAGTGELKRGSCQEQKAGIGFRARGKREEQGFPPGKGVLNRGYHPRRESTGQGFPLGQGFPPEEVKNNVFQMDEGFRQKGLLSERGS